MPNNLVLTASKSKSSSRASSKNGASRSRMSALPYAAALLLFAGGKASRVFAAFASFHYLQSGAPLPTYLLACTAGAALCLVLLQRPWHGKRIGVKRARRVVMAGLLMGATLFSWAAGLRLAGPLRTLMVDGAELPLVYISALVRRREVPERRKTRGAALMLLAYLLLMWDASGHVPDVEQLEHSALGQRAEHTLERLSKQPWVGVGMANVQRRLVQRFDVAGDKVGTELGVTTWRCEVGVVLVLAASIMMQCGRAMTRRLATELGGGKRYFALGTSVASGWVALGTALWTVFGGMDGGEVTLKAWMSWAVVGVLWLIIPYYVRAVVSRSVGTRLAVSGGVVLPFVMGVAGSAAVGAARCGGGASWVLLAAFTLNATGVSLMMAGGARRALSELPLDAPSTSSSAVAPPSSSSSAPAAPPR
ncbi:hypothetical protein BWQ96_00552 [Gracilariopsis chorda]|uniref:EamA domain-containing protein n=1 Tax=Gracilariopsis chorda TaxID=448386 RepID=A0A2V3J5M2_9FLOR|nr:hypothetical protein BWQ96_00552 [Gracilariopsis chorda]|eukprot:PXF49674.1 hypothetical protein BWQ96_00552 [Gracilariopsis chorda]